ncbi:hypothetical protein PAXRUDRAFT_36289 [Paxillus rubicundulus Ve08.2h10]|uniref:Thioester reductase (TE) domain-containing protein n=1 Tax=Paxillus rubicundulus Ve08.2h10 TaxID=930991 RepID=A0A0D0D8L2_9AGAM|nr:hypothetical protein PAXRUDRAFT_36289 [Paxillus rubicundulus Ve08.2h10]
MSAPSQTIFFLGATGYLGSQFLPLLNNKLPELRVVALLHNFTPERQEQIREVYSNISFVEGTLDDGPPSKCKMYISFACRYSPADENLIGRLIATLADLETNSRNHPEKPPLYVSGCGIISDNARGEPVEIGKGWSDIGFGPTLIEAGLRTKNTVRTIIYFPVQIYGVCEGKQLDSLAPGDGANAMDNIHVKDRAMGLFLVLQAALEGEADEGPDGLMEPRITYTWTKVMGNYLHSKGIIKGGSRPMPPEVIGPLDGWSFLGGNRFLKPQRLAKLGWEATASKILPLLESFPGAHEGGLTVPLVVS